MSIIRSMTVENKKADINEGTKAQKGLFISTATFSPGARRPADATGFVLVDGKQLTKLMIKFNLGVSIEYVYEVKRLDTDFFTDGF